MDSSGRRSMRLMLAGLLLPVMAAVAGAADLYQRGQVQPSERTGSPTPSAWSCAIVGSVATPAAYAIESAEFTAAALVEQAGGLTADSSGILRIVRNGAARIQIPMSAAGTERLLPGDVVIAEYNRAAADRLAQPANGLSPVCVIGLSTRPVVLPLRAENATLGSLLSLLRQSPNIAPGVRVIRPLGSPAAIGDQLTAGTVLVFDTRLLNWQSLATVHAFPPAIPVRQLEPRGTGSGATTAYGQPATLPGAQRTPMMLAAPGATEPAALSAPAPTTGATPVVPTDTEPVASQSDRDAAPTLTPPLDPAPPEEPAAVPHVADDELAAAAPPQPTADISAVSARNRTAPTLTVPAGDTDRADAAASATHDTELVTGETASIVPVSTVTDVEPAEPEETPAEAELAGTSVPHPEQTATPPAGISMWPLMLGMVVVIGVCLTGAFAWFRWEQTGPIPPSSTLMDDPVPSERREPEHRRGQETLLAALLENRIPLIEEETVVRPLGPVQGTVTGRRYLMIDDAHAELRGPHVSKAVERAVRNRPAERAPLKVLHTDLGLHRVDVAELADVADVADSAAEPDDPQTPVRRMVEPTPLPPVVDDVVLPEEADRQQASSEHTSDLLERALLAMERERRK